MSEDIYAAPEADVRAPVDDTQGFYVVSLRKFYLLSLLTVDLYFVYWFYRNWRIIKDRTGESMWPAMRGLFYIFFTDIDESLRDKESDFEWRPASTATLFVVLVVIVNILAQLSNRGVGVPTTDLIWLVMIPILPFVLFSAQRAINVASDDPQGAGNATFTRKLGLDGHRRPPIAAQPDRTLRAAVRA